MKLSRRICTVQIILAMAISVSNSAAQANDCINYSDVSPTYITTIATYGYASELVIVGDLGYLATHGGLSVWDVSNPGTPTQLSVLETYGGLTGIWVYGSYAYVSSLWPEVYVIDISNPLIPTLAGSVATADPTYDITGEGNLLCVSGPLGITTIDITTPSDPRILGIAGTAGGFWDIAISGGIVYGANHLEIVSTDVSDPANPIVLARQESPGQAMGLKIRGDYAYLSAMDHLNYNSYDQSPKFSIVDISDPTAMVVVGAVYTGSSSVSRDIALRGNYAYLPDDRFGLIVIDIEDPAAPSVVGHGSIGEGNHVGSGIALKDETAIICDGDSGLMTYDLSGPQILDSLTLPGQTWNFEVHGDLAYVGSGDASEQVPRHHTGLQIISVADPTNMQLLSSLSFPSFTHLIGVVGNNAYLRGTTSRNLYVVDISDPLNPVEINHTEAPGIVQEAAVDGNFLVACTDSGEVVIYDISLPDMPTEAATIALPFPGTGITIKDDRIYVTSRESGLAILDWSTPPYAVIAGSIDFPTTLRLIGVHKKMAYLVQTQAPTILVLDTSNPLAIQVTSGMEYIDGVIPSPLSMAIRGDTGYLGTFDQGLLILDLTDPLRPRATKQLDIPSVARVCVANDNLFALSFNWEAWARTLYSVGVDCASLSAVHDTPRQMWPSHLAQNHPNPFNPETTITFDLPHHTAVSLRVFDLSGRLVKVLIEQQMFQQGRGEATWNGRDDKGKHVAAGVYFYRMDAGEVSQTRRMVLVK